MDANSYGVFMRSEGAPDFWPWDELRVLPSLWAAVLPIPNVTGKSQLPLEWIDAPLQESRLSVLAHHQFPPFPISLANPFTPSHFWLQEHHLGQPS